MLRSRRETSAGSRPFLRLVAHITSTSPSLSKLSILRSSVESILRFTIILAHYCLQGHVDKRDVHLLRYDFGRRRLAATWRALEQHAPWSVCFILHPCRRGDLIVH